MAAVAAAMVATASGSDALALAAHARQVATAPSAVPDPVLLGPEEPPGFDGWVVGALPAWFASPPPPAAPALPRSSIPPPTAPIVAALGASGIPEVALRAYVHAAQSVAVSDPSCRLDWSVLAAIGRVESNHGRFGGAQLRADGSTTRPILGIPLDGRPGVARILDTDDGAFDGDVTYDRAVGPMQFLPSTWHFVAADGNGDGAADPNNIFDATLGAARYLCAGGADLGNRAALTAAILRYNHSDAYAALVLALADAYRTGHRVLPAAEPVSPAPPVASPALPPATVGDPPGLGDIGAAAGDPITPPSSPPSSTPPPSCPPTTDPATGSSPASGTDPVAGTPSDSANTSIGSTDSSGLTDSSATDPAMDCPPTSPPPTTPPPTPPPTTPPPTTSPAPPPPTSSPPSEPPPSSPPASPPTSSTPADPPADSSPPADTSGTPSTSTTEPPTSSPAASATAGIPTAPSASGSAVSASPE
ncbi:MAG TPA: lytic transglycosylase domain-containing protein [Mycobacteriales bacterium]|nr:lytic transglycosylase domain-containing protein [Mycobacteriales bacterium]